MVGNPDIVKHSTPFTSENQPSNKAKSEGMKEYWKSKKAAAEARDRVLKHMMELAGFTEDGESNLEIQFAQGIIGLLEGGDIEGFQKSWKEMLPEKPKQVNVDQTTKNIDLSNRTDEEIDALIKNTEVKGE